MLNKPRLIVLNINKAWVLDGVQDLNEDEICWWWQGYAWQEKSIKDTL